MESGQKNRRATQALILFVLGAALTYCSESNEKLLVGGDSTPPSLQPPGRCEVDGIALSFQTGTRGSIEVTCPSAGQTATEAKAIPYSGFEFERWTNGEEQVLTETLVIENPSEAQAWTAEFGTSGLNTVWLAYSFVQQSQVYLEGFVKETKNSEGLVVSEGLGFNQHTDTIFTNSGCTGSPGFMRDEAQRNVAPDDNGNGTSAAAYLDDPANEGKIDNLVLTYYPHIGSTFEDYKYWIDKLRVYNKNARVFIVTPWSRGPETSHSLHSQDSNCEHVWPDDAKDENGNFINIDQYTSQIYVKENDNSAVNIEKDIYYSEDESILASLPNFKKNVLSKLEAEFDNKIIIVPQIAVASRILQAQYQNTLSYGDDPSNQATLAVTGDMDTSIFNDETGHGSTILRLSAAMLYASYLYDEDIDTEAYRAEVWDNKDEYINAGAGTTSTDFDHKLSYYQGLDLVGLISDIYNGEETTDYLCGGHRVTLRADAMGSIEGKFRRCVNNGASTSVEAKNGVGYTFHKWSDDNSNASRTIENITSDLTLTAQYQLSGYRTVWLANDMVRYSVPFLKDIAESAEYTTHEDILFYDDGGTFGNLAIRNLKDQAENIASDQGSSALTYLQNNEINNLVLVHSNTDYDNNDILAMKNWIEIAVDKSPGVRIFIVVPWHYQVSHLSDVIPDWSDDNGNDFDYHWGSTAVANNDLADLLAQARQLVPSNEVIVIPQMMLARSIHRQYQSDSSNYLKYQNGHEISNCHISQPGLSYFSREIGCNNTITPEKAIPGPVLSVPTALLYMSYLYDQPISDIKQVNGQTVVTKASFDFAESDENGGDWGDSLDTNLDDNISQSLSVYGTVESGTGTFTSYSFETTLNDIYNNDSNYNP